MKRLLDRLRDGGADLREMLVSAALGYLTMEVVVAVVGPLHGAVFSLGALAVALVLLYGVVPRLRRGRWRPPS